MGNLPAIDIGACRGSPGILLVDDEPDILELLTEVLKNNNYSVLQAPDGECALALLAKHPEISILISDICMPGMNGVELADRAESVRAGIKVILMSGYAPRYGDVRHPFLRKPFRIVNLLKAVAAADAH